MLLLVLWAIVVLTSAVMLFAAFMRQTLKIASQQYNDTDARAMAFSGVSFALHPLVSKETPALLMHESSDPGYSVKIISEGRKLNLNFIFGSLAQQQQQQQGQQGQQGQQQPAGPVGADAMKLDIFRRWLEFREIEFNDREQIIDCIIDYLDGDDLKRLNGLEATETYFPPNRGQFLSVEELKDVAGLDPLTSQGGWMDDLTVDSNGGIDVTAAELHIMRLLPGLGDSAIQRFIQWRQGADGVDGTLDDPPIQNLQTVQQFLGLSQAQWNQFGGVVNLRDNTWSVISKGWSGNVHRQIEVVARKGGQNPTIVRWKE